MTTQQLQSSGAIVQIMQGVSDTTEQSSTSTRDASQNMERLARLVEQLRASVEAFKLREDQNFYAPTQFDITPIENEQNNQMTVSGIFRTVTGAAQPPNARSYNALPPAGPPPPYSPYPVAPYQPNGRQVAPQRSGQRN